MARARARFSPASRRSARLCSVVDMAASNHRRPYDHGVASTRSQPVEPVAVAPPVPMAVRSGPPPLHGGPWTFLRFARRNQMLTPGYILLFARFLWLKLRWVRVGHNAVIGTNSVVTTEVPDNAVVGGVPARLIRMREAPKTFRWG